MKTLRDYMVETQQWLATPAVGDDFAIELDDGTLIETYIMAIEGNAVLLDATPEIYAALSQWAQLCEDDDTQDSELTVLSEGQMKEIMWRDAERMSLEQFVGHWGDEDWIREFWTAINGPMDEDQGAGQVAAKAAAEAPVNTMGDIDEAKYQGREVPLGKPMAGDVKKSKVYVRDPSTGNVKKVNFGDPNMKIKKSNPARRKSFRARHNCANPGPRTKARYWSCRAW
jgi:hypothetical protein